MRQEGYYWVEYARNEWEVAEWNGEYWSMIGSESVFIDANFVSIGKRVFPPSSRSNPLIIKEGVFTEKSLGLNRRSKD